MIQAYVISLVLGLGFWSAINRLFTELKDGGLALSKLLGGIVIALVVWFLSYAGLAVNTNAGVFMVGSLVIIGAIVWGKIDLRKINWRVVIVEEILFALGFFGLAMVRGFNPDIARLLLKQDYIFESIQLVEFTGKSKNDLLRLKGRVIGKDGKSRRLIEELSETYISGYGKSISIIGTAESSYMAKKAVAALLMGSTHANVYKWLEKKRRELKRKRVMEMI